MSVDALSWAFRLQLPPIDKLIMLALADRADEWGGCFPSGGDIAWRTGVHERTIRKVVGRMIAAGIVAVEKRFRPGGMQTSNHYQLQIGEAGAVGFLPRRVPSRSVTEAGSAPAQPPPLPGPTAPPTPGPRPPL